MCVCMLNNLADQSSIQGISQMSYATLHIPITYPKLTRICNVSGELPNLGR